MISRRHGIDILRFMARTLIDVDDELLADAARALGTRTKRDTVNAALRAVGTAAGRLHELEMVRSGKWADPEAMRLLREDRSKVWRR
jgi:Arc/MetJ family transcription regulator